MYRVTFPFDMKLPGDTDEGEDAEYLYLLKGVVVHVGSGPNHGTPCLCPHASLARGPCCG